VSPERDWGRYEGETLTVVYSAECKAIQKTNRSSGMLPLLVVLFVFSYGILTLLVVEQGRTIDSQRFLIREMVKDSDQLAALKSKMAREEGLKARQKALDAGPSAPANQQKDSPGIKGSGKDGKGTGKSSHLPKEVPGRPDSDLQDVRRATRII
jgi:hypothetical protein